MNYEKISPKTIKHIYTAYASLTESPLNPKLRALVELRTSQINGCAYCCTMHCKDARKAGVSEQQLDELSAWQTSSCFDSKESLALSWCEAVTFSRPGQNELRAQLEEHFSERELVDLTVAISLMNALNRIAVNLRDD